MKEGENAINPEIRVWGRHFRTRANGYRWGAREIEGYVIGGEAVGTRRDPHILQYKRDMFEHTTMVDDFYKRLNTYVYNSDELHWLVFSGTAKRVIETTHFFLERLGNRLKFVDESNPVYYLPQLNERFNTSKISGKKYSKVPLITDYWVTETGSIYFPSAGETPDEMRQRIVNAWKFIRETEQKVPYKRFASFIIGSGWSNSIMIAQQFDPNIGWKRATQNPSKWSYGGTIFTSCKFPDYLLTLENLPVMNEYTHPFEKRKEKLELYTLKKGGKSEIIGGLRHSISLPDKENLLSIRVYSYKPESIAYRYCKFDILEFTRDKEHIITHLACTETGHRVGFSVNRKLIPEVDIILEKYRPNDQTPKRDPANQYNTFEYSFPGYSVTTIDYTPAGLSEVNFIGDPDAFPEEIKNMINSRMSRIEELLEISEDLNGGRI